MNKLRLGLSVESRPKGNILVYFENLGIPPLDLFIAIGEVHRVEFTAITLDRRMLKVTDAVYVRPCAGICNYPVLERVYPGVVKYTYPVEKHIYIPPKGPSPNLAALLQSCSLQASFEMTFEQLKDAGPKRLEHPWFGRLTTPEIRL